MTPEQADIVGGIIGVALVMNLINCAIIWFRWPQQQDPEP